MERQQDYVLRTVEERGIRFIQLWFTDVLGIPKCFNITPGRVGERPRGGHDLRRLGHRRVQPGPGERRSGPSRPEDVPAPPLRDRQDARGPGGLRHHQPRRDAFRGRPPPRAAPDAWRRPGASASPSIAPRSSSTSTSSPRSLRRCRRYRPGPPRPRLVLRADHRRPGHRAAPHDRAHPGGHGHPGRVQPARGRPEPARDRPALHRRPHHGRHGHDGAPGGQGDRRAAGHPGHLHAEAAGRRAGLGHAHPSLPLRRRHQRLPRRGRRATTSPRRAGGSSPGCSPTPPRSPPSPTSGSTPTSG